MSGAGSGDSCFDRSVRLFAALHAVEEVLHVCDGAVSVAAFAKCGILFAGQSFAIDGHAASIELEGCVGAAEFEAAVVDRRSHHAFIDNVESWIAQGRLHCVGTLPLIEDVFVAQHERVLRLVRFHRPLGHVDPVGEEVGHGASAEVPEPAPAVIFLDAEWLIGSAAEPLLPIELFRVDGFRDPADVVVLPPVSSDLDDPPKASTLDQFDGIAEVGPAALLHAALQDLFAGADGLRQGRAFFEGVGDGLFKIHVFPGGK